MKKFLLFAAATAVALSSCSKNEVVDNTTDPANAIGFGSYYANSVSRADGDFQDGSVFAVSAYFTNNANFTTTATDVAASFMGNQVVTYTESTTSWSYSPLKYWPNDTDDKVSFFAVSDDSATAPASLSTTSNLPSFTVASVTDGSASNILVAKAMNKTKSATAVALTFKHAMAGLKFTAQNNAKLTETGETDATTNTTVTVTDLNIAYSSLYTTGGTFTFDAASEDTSIGSWSYDGAALTNVVDNNASLAKVLNNDGTTVSNILDGIFIVPNDNNAATVTVKYTVATTGTAGAGNDSSVDNTATFTIKPTKMNTLYTYNIKISLTGVTVTGTIDTDWDSASTTTYPVVVVDSDSQVIPTVPAA